jgi:hypothetical protein
MRSRPLKRMLTGDPVEAIEQAAQVLRSVLTSLHCHLFLRRNPPQRAVVTLMIIARKYPTPNRDMSVATQRLAHFGDRERRFHSMVSARFI